MFYGMAICAFAFIFGLAVGSFLNAVIYRLEKEESVVLDKFSKGNDKKKKKMARSYCPHCGTALCWHDLIPVLSFVFLRGKCRYCNEKISIQYPIVEIVTGILFVLIARNVFNLEFGVLDLFWIPDSGFRILTLCYMLHVICSMIVIFVYDLKHYIIPDKILFPAIVVSIMYQAASIMYAQDYASYFIPNTLYYFGAAFLASGFFLALVVFSKGRWMGMGDVKLAFLMGLILGWPGILVALFLAFTLGATVGILLVLISGGPFFLRERFSKNWGLKSQIPFGPFLIVGTFIALFWGEKIINWYLGLLF